MKSVLRAACGSFAIGLVACAPVQQNAASDLLVLPENTFPVLRLPERFSLNNYGPRISVSQLAAVDPGEAKAVTLPNEASYYTAVTVGNKSFNLIVDTGSSDLWIAKSNFVCQRRVNGWLQNSPTNSCGFGQLFQGEFPGGKIANQYLNISYGDRITFINGDFGYADITVNKLTIPKQQFALATDGVWRGDQITSGILGLGLPGLTAAYDVGLRKEGHYNPLVTTMSKSGVKPIFTLALSKNQSSSVITLGGIPDIPHGEFAVTPMAKYKQAPKDYTYYVIEAEKMHANNTSLTKDYNATEIPQLIIDSGTTLAYLPYQMTKAINQLFAPHAVEDPSVGFFMVNCKAKPPTISLQIGGKTIYIDPKNMIKGSDAEGGCISGIQSGGSGPFLLGDTFMEGLVVVHDLDKMQMQFAPRL